MRLLALLAFAVLIAACGDSAPIATMQSPVPAPTVQPSPPPPPVVASVREVMLGERVEDVFGDGQTIHPGEHHFFVTVPRDGTLVVSLSWDPRELGTLLMLRLDDRVFLPPRDFSASPVVGRLPVEARKRYLMAVGLAGADWLPEDRFVLTSGLEP